jgi:hypothetical protein
MADAQNTCFAAGLLMITVESPEHNKQRYLFGSMPSSRLSQNHQGRLSTMNNDQTQTGTQPTTRVHKPFITADRILAPELLNRLSYHARRYYAGAWNVSNWRSKNPIWLDESRVCASSNVKPEALDDIRRELISNGLIKYRPALPNSKDNKALYELVDPDKEWYDIFKEPTE